MNRKIAMKLIKAILLLLLLPSPTLPALGQDYPSRPITLVVPFSAGGPGDVIARLLGSSMSATLKQPLIIENVVGAGGTIGTNRVAKAAPDGYTLLLMHIGQATAPALYAKLPFDPVGDFAPIGMVTDVPMILVARPNFPAKDLTELVATVRAQGDKLTYGNVGLGSASHLCGLMFMSAIETKLTAVYYKGGGPALNDVIAGHIDVYCDPATGPTPYIQAGTIPGYAITGKKRVPTLRSRPTGIRRHDLVWHVRAARHAEADRGCARRRPAKGAQGSGPDQPLRRTQHDPGRRGARDTGGA
jgi:tripartite-type tricarboxylate transporter receptor subunit TctC